MPAEANGSAIVDEVVDGRLRGGTLGPMRPSPPARLASVPTLLRLASLALWALLGPGCGATAAVTRPASRPPRLVVLVVYDQLGSSVLAQHESALSPEGAVRWIGARGLVVERARYAYAGTFTAPGHAAIVTGVGPSESGVSANRVWDRARHARISSFDDGVHAIVGREDGFATLASLRARTVSDVLAEASSGQARIVALGMKDRSALPPGGHTPTLTLWFDALAGGFTTSSELRPELPAWLLDFRATHPWESYRRPWEPLRAYDELGPDEAPGEGGYGFDAAFPHDARGLSDIDAFLSLPSSTELLLELAERAIVEEHLGEDEVVDFLSLSIASTDYVGHAFGPDSWEYRDQLVRIDAMVGRFLARLAERTELAVLLTSDHGVVPLPERAAAHGLPPSVRWASQEELPLLRAHLETTLGARDGGWVDGWVVPYVYLSDEVRRDEALRARAIAEISRYLLGRPGVGYVLDVREGPSLRGSEDEITRAIGRSISAEPPGDLYVLPSSGSAADDTEGSSGTSHGSPFDYDREVPVLISGPGVARGRTSRVHEQSRVAATLAHLLGVSAPHPAAPLLDAE